MNENEVLQAEIFLNGSFSRHILLKIPNPNAQMDPRCYIALSFPLIFVM